MPDNRFEQAVFELEEFSVKTMEKLKLSPRDMVHALQAVSAYMKLKAGGGEKKI